jgi:hypothetical protein
MRCLLLAFGFLVFTSNIRAQQIMSGVQSGGRPLLVNGDMAVLEGGEFRKDLECIVTPARPVLGFDLKFHTGFDVSVPMKELEGNGDMLNILFRVTPKDMGDPVYFSQQIRVPAIHESKGTATLNGLFDLGEGIYQVDWLMHDYTGRYCSSFWETDAVLLPKDKQVALMLPARAIRRAENEEFQPEPPVQRSPEAPLNVKVLMNFAPQRRDSASVDTLDTMALVSILRNISRNPRIGKFTLVAFNIQEQRVLYRQDSSDHIDFPSMGKALKTLSLGTVDLHRLERKNGDTEFLSGLIRNETNDQTNPDGLIFIGPKALIDSSVPQDDLKQVGDLEYPVFYMNYALDPAATPWKDAISRTVKFFKGREYTISGPRDLWNAVAEVVSRMAKSKQSHVPGSAPTGQP